MMDINGEECRERLKGLLRELFQFDVADLDFGIYKIMNHRREAIKRFIEVDLIAHVETAFKEYSGTSTETLKGELKQLRAQINEFFGPGTIDEDGAAKRHTDAPKVQEYLRKLDDLRSAELTQGQIEDIYNQVYEFFSRYFDNGDFLSKRRYGGRDKYILPHNGEEVQLHWANHDQYYIKTAENFNDYKFVVDGWAVHFVLTHADVEENNVMGADRFYIISKNEAPEIDSGSKNLKIFFQYRGLTDAEAKALPKRDKQKQLNEQSLVEIHNAVAGHPLDSALKRTVNISKDVEKQLVEKHLDDYVKKNSHDYFIHKDLYAFLKGELDFYIKNEVLQLDEFLGMSEGAVKQNMARVKAILEISEPIILFLAQIEEFQKMLFEKKKFVLSTEYCVTLDMVPEELYPDIISNKDQIDEWKALYLIGSSAQKKIFGTEFNVELLKTYPSLMLDTRFFDRDFKDKLLASFHNLDDATSGLLIDSENLQAINLLNAKHHGNIACVHIDPPYNTQTSGFLYKNAYKHSSWLSMMGDRIRSSMDLMTPYGAFMCHIDENEYELLYQLFNQIGIPDGGTIIWDKKNPMLGRKGIATQHEYILWRTWLDSPIYLRPVNVRMILEQAEKIIQKNGGVSDKARKEFSDWITSRKDLSGGEKAYCLIDDDGRVYQSVGMGAPEPRKDPKFHIPLPHPITNKNCPVPRNGWSRSPVTLRELMAKGEIIFGRDECIQPRLKVFLTNESKRQMSSVIQNASRGKKDLDKLGLEFPYCHPVSLYEDLIGAAAEGNDVTLDFFAGSGTTAHAIINLNREDGGSRKYILVEMGEHFDSILKPRIMKVVYTSEWDSGTPQLVNGISHMFKYIRLEQYEDTLTNIAIQSQSGTIQETLLTFDDFFVRYLLDFETRNSPVRASPGMFEEPFDNKLLTVSGGEERASPVDLVETFNYLIGLHVERVLGLYDGNRYYRAIRGKRDNDKTILIVWRSTKDLDLERDRDFIQENIMKQLLEGEAVPDTIYVNGVCQISGAFPIEPDFKKLMGA